jgi:serine protease AprX
MIHDIIYIESSRTNRGLGSRPTPMKREQVEQLFYGKVDEHRRFTQDFPILPDVWIAFAENLLGRCELLLTPHTRSDAPTLARALGERLHDEQNVGSETQELWSGKDAAGNEPSILFNGSVVLAEFSFWELMRVAMPLTDWWAHVIAPIGGTWTRENLADVASGKTKVRDVRMLTKLISIVGALDCDRRGETLPKEAMEGKVTPEQVKGFTAMFEGLTNPAEKRGLLWSVSKNRKPTMSLWRSRNAVKADAAARLFDVQTEGVRWAVLDTGIDAKHPAFARRGVGPDRPILDKPVANEEGTLEFPTRVVRTYDFLRFKWLVNPDAHDPAKKSRYKPPEEFRHSAAPSDPQELEKAREELRESLHRSRGMDWDLLEPFLRVPHTDDRYVKPGQAHGTHVAGIIAADWPEAEKTPIEQPIQGMCPGLEIYDIRVLGENADEFTTIAALQFVGHLNAHKDLMMIHGVNISMSVVHDVANYACGSTESVNLFETLFRSSLIYPI